MAAKFTASAADLRSAAAFLDALNDATEAGGVHIDGRFDLRLGNGDTILARWDGEQYIVDDEVSGDG